MNLLELMLVVAITTIIGGNQFANTGLEHAKAIAVKSQTNLGAIAEKVGEFCQDTQRQCTGLVNGNVILPADYMLSIPQDPSATSIAAAQYQITLNTNASDGSKCWSLEGDNSYIHDAVLNVPNADGSFNAPNAAGAPAFLHYDSRASAVYQGAANTSPVAGGC